MYEAELKIAKEAAIKAGEFLNKRRDIKVDELNGKDIKLSSDKLSEKIIFDILTTTEIPILSEEKGFVGIEGEYCWIVDPLDGTINYYKSMDELACVSIALCKDKEPVLGVVYRFANKELFYGIVGKGAFLNEKAIKPSDIMQIEQAVMATGFPVKRNYSTNSLNKFVKQVQHFKKVRMLGTAAIMSTFVANGRIDAYFEDQIMLWDIAAAKAIVDAAGGETSLEILEDNKCLYKAFSNKKLMEDFYAKSL